jgi:hypothetical protein
MKVDRSYVNFTRTVRLSLSFFHNLRYHTRLFESANESDTLIESRNFDFRQLTDFGAACFMGNVSAITQV